MSKIISVFGPPESGKTTVSVALSECLADKGYNVCLVCCDDLVPTIPVLLPQSVGKIHDTADKVHSIGKILNSVEFSTEDILQQCVYTKKYNKLILIGYALGENRNTYPTPTDYDVYSFYAKLSSMVDYIVVDCSSDLVGSSLSRVGISHSDSVLRLGGSSYKDIVYFASVNDVIPDGDVDKKDHIVLFSKVKKSDVLEDLSDFYGGIDYQIKDSKDVRDMLRYGECFVKEFPSAYKAVIQKIVEEVNFS